MTACFSVFFTHSVFTLFHFRISAITVINHLTLTLLLFPVPQKTTYLHMPVIFILQVFYVLLCKCCRQVGKTPFRAIFSRITVIGRTIYCQFVKFITDKQHLPSKHRLAKPQGIFHVFLLFFRTFCLGFCRLQSSSRFNGTHYACPFGCLG